MSSFVEQVQVVVSQQAHVVQHGSSNSCGEGVHVVCRRCRIHDNSHAASIHKLQNPFEGDFYPVRAVIKLVPQLVECLFKQVGVKKRSTLG